MPQNHLHLPRLHPQHRFGEWLLHRLFPPRCLLCGTLNGLTEPLLDLCAGCMADLVLVEHPCPTCGLPLDHSSGEWSCTSCDLLPPPFSAAWIPFRYQFPLDRLVKGLKFGRRMLNARLLAALMVRQWPATEAWLDPPQLLVPVPLHRQRERQRGFNQAAAVAEHLGHSLQIPTDPFAMERHRSTRPQTELDGEQRRMNLREAFTVVRRDWPESVAIVDDVVTTATTASEIASLLQEAGVAEVQIWAVARGGLFTGGKEGGDKIGSIKDP